MSAESCSRSWNTWPSGHLAPRGVIVFSSQMSWDFWLIFAFLGIVIPWRGRVRLKRLLALDKVDSKEKISLYATTIGFQWIFTWVVAWRAVARGLTPSELGLSGGDSMRFLLPGLIGALVIGGLHWLNLRRVAQMEGAAADLLRSIARKILPNSRVEFLPYFALAVTAGVCEEFLYRGFAMAALTKVGLPTWSVVALTSLLFGLAHTYQGKSGVLGTGLLGVVFGCFRVVYESLVPVSIWHATVDLVAGVAGSRYLLKDNEGAQGQANQGITG
jgi:uncharacterized protein